MQKDPQNDIEQKQWNIMEQNSIEWNGTESIEEAWATENAWLDSFRHLSLPLLITKPHWKSFSLTLAIFFFHFIPLLLILSLSLSIYLYFSTSF